jgi:hypothetical protein
MHKHWELRGGTLLQTRACTGNSAATGTLLAWRNWPRTFGPLVPALLPRTVAELSRRSCLRGSLELEAT